jgi:CheY-like chemotaxis protein
VSRILVVEDDSALQWIAKAALTRLGGHEVTTASSAREAIAALGTQSFDVVLLDAMMPDEDGSNVLAFARADPALAAIPIVMVTARSSEADRARYRSLGARGVIPKPFDPKTLHEDLARVLASSP